VETLVHVPANGHYDIWVGGAFRRGLDLLVDGRQLSSERNALSHSGQYTPIGEATLTAGVHRLTLRYGEADLHPGSGDPPFHLGPLVLATRPDTSVRYVHPRDARSLCGMPLDWIESLR
jgi:hypothetical protein